jgi:hypothetical protein
MFCLPITGEPICTEVTGGLKIEIIVKPLPHGLHVEVFNMLEKWLLEETFWFGHMWITQLDSKRNSFVLQITMNYKMETSP